jgi:hypothetical protein
LIFVLKDREIMQYVIIAGTLRAGTTSLCRYLSDHPRICGSSVKETYFFLDADHYRPAEYRFANGLDKYQSFFANCQASAIRLEATPHYLYSPSTVRMLRSALSSVKLIFILRDPVERLLSAYRLAIQLDTLPVGIESFDDYVLFQFEHLDDTPEVPPRALKYGRYSVYLSNYTEVFAPEEICVLNFTDLKDNPHGLLKEVCNFIGIDVGFYIEYDFRVLNRSVMIKKVEWQGAYRNLRQSVKKAVNRWPTVYKWLSFGWHILVRPLYYSINQDTDRQIRISPSVKARLHKYYKDEPSALKNLIGFHDTTWSV